MRTRVSLESVGALLEGRHENPFEVLGPHVVDHEGRQALAVDQAVGFEHATYQSQHSAV